MSSKKEQKMELRTPKGTVDRPPTEALTHKKMVAGVVEIFERHGGLPLDTPTFELRPILTNKYGEDSKLIYDLADQGGDICSLRYDLTVPFARYVAANRVSRMRRYAVGPVYRRDNPSFKTGRLREFTQADFDICGETLPMMAEAEILSMIDAILSGMRLCTGAAPTRFVTRINDRRIIAGMLFLCGVAAGLFGTICSTIDKADKLSWAELSNEFSEKGLEAAQIDGIHEYLEMQGRTNEEVIAFLDGRLAGVSDESAPAVQGFRKAVEELKLLMNYTKTMRVESVRIDLSLARGLDYYTGLIIEASLVGSEIGSVVGGGRYDNLCSSISKHSVPCIGFSVGISRLMAVAAKAAVSSGVFVGSAYGLMAEERLALLGDLWAACMQAQTFPGKRVNFKEQLEYATKNGFRVAVFTGENESRQGLLLVVDVQSGEKVEIPRGELIEKLSAYFN
ncbi:histidyl-tRNA synthetase [Pancytospora philotis]|nr:histidyl-tRNA synthetase [Pancytospora philotis]